MNKYNKKRRTNDGKAKKKRYANPKTDLSLQLNRWGKGTHRHVLRVSDTFICTYNGATQFTGKAWAFKFSDYSGQAGLEAVYDRYRICWVTADFYPRQNSFSSTDLIGTFASIPSLVTVVDKDDATTPTAYADLLQFSTAQTHAWDRPFSRTFKPLAALAAYGGAFTSYASAQADQWYDCASPDIQFYGFKVGTFPYPLANSGDSPTWDVVFTYYMEFKHTR